MSCFDHHHRTGRCVLAGTAVLLAACGSGATGLDDDDQDAVASTADPGSTGTQPDGEEYSWFLPTGDTSVSLNEAVTYARLFEGNCSGAQQVIDEGWRGFLNPRNVLLFQAAVEFCRGERGAGRDLYGEADRRYGWAGTSDYEIMCNAYRATTSVARQVAPESVTCESGEPEPWPTFNPDEMDDPRTPEVEGTTTTTAEATTTTTTIDTTTTTAAATTTTSGG